jgi:hypothetical protein
MSGTNDVDDRYSASTTTVFPIATCFVGDRVEFRSRRGPWSVRVPTGIGIEWSVGERAEAGRSRRGRAAR